MPGTNDEMPFLDHLEELRRRLFWIFGSLFVGVLIAFLFHRRIHLFESLQWPLAKVMPGVKLTTLHPAEPFTIAITASLILGVVLASPVIIYQIWAFLSPGLLPREKRVLIPVMFTGLLLFLGGIALCFFLVMPISLKFLVEFSGDAFNVQPTANYYFGFLFSMCLAFGVVFEMPMVVLALSALGIVNARVLNKFRRYAIVILIVLSAVVTPDGNPMTLLLMFVPLYILYELSVLISLLIQRGKEKRERLEAQEEARREAAR